MASVDKKDAMIYLLKWSCSMILSMKPSSPASAWNAR